MNGIIIGFTLNEPTSVQELADMLNGMIEKGYGNNLVYVHETEDWVGEIDILQAEKESL